MPQWTDLRDVRDDSLGADEDFSDQQVTRLIDRAERMILRDFPTTEKRIADGDLSVDTVSDVVSAMAIRVLRNPEGIRTIQDSSGPHSGSTTFAGDNPGQLYLTDEDKRALNPGASSGRRAFSVMPNYARR